jgi:NAD-dependent glycerol-3-phosphate dehydrogenase N-terminus
MRSLRCTRCRCSTAAASWTASRFILLLYRWLIHQPKAEVVDSFPARFSARVHIVLMLYADSMLQGVLPPDLPIISVSKGLEVSTGSMMSEIIPSALQRKQPAVFLSGPSFAREVMELCPTVVVAASKVGVAIIFNRSIAMLPKMCIIV